MPTLHHWSVKPVNKSDFAYELPRSLIAQSPVEPRDASRLLHVGSDTLRHRQFQELPELLTPGDLLVVNNTKVIKARLHGTKDSGGRVEILVERVLNATEAKCQVRASKPLKAGRTLRVAGCQVSVVKREGEFYQLGFPTEVLDFLSAHGEVPLPPYIERPANPSDAGSYQSVFGSAPGAVAAPTASLHFSTGLLDRLQTQGIDVAEVTLHVGAGTFQPVRTENLSEHRMHAERYCLTEAAMQKLRDCQGRGGRIVAVGTTVVRTLEGIVLEHGCLRPCSGETRLFITPGYAFKVVDILVTNFHLPESTLLMLVCAFAGYDRVMNAYAAATRERYRFFSYGDAMLLERRLQDV